MAKPAILGLQDFGVQEDAYGIQKDKAGADSSIRRAVKRADRRLENKR
jgi:hypothetical protein